VNYELKKDYEQAI
jgi:tetratricopeptide (TPR) repeat protein